MRALQYRQFGREPEVVEVPVPSRQGEQLLMRVDAAGLCHSDVHIVQRSPQEYTYGLPLTLGHEVAGTVVEASPANSHMVGHRYLVYGPWGCGTCLNCTRGYENYCSRGQRLGIRPPGLGSPGGIADYVVIDSARHLVPLGNLDPTRAVPLTDAGLTPYAAIRSARRRLGPGSTAMVIGIGGLGHVAVALLTRLTAARVIAVDMTTTRLEFAAALGAHHTFLSDEHLPSRVREATAGLNADFVLDLVGTSATLDRAVDCLAVGGQLTIAGIGGGVVPLSFDRLPRGAGIGATYWSGRHELQELVALHADQPLPIAVQSYDLSQAADAYRALAAGELVGRAVIEPRGGSRRDGR